MNNQIVYSIAEEEIKRIYEAGLIPAGTRRVLVDFEVGKVTRIVFECHGDKALIDPIVDIVMAKKSIVTPAHLAPEEIEMIAGWYQTAANESGTKRTESMFAL